MANGLIAQIDAETGALKVEAEDIIAGNGDYLVENQNVASGGQVASLFNGDGNRSGVTGLLSYAFEGEAGTYDISITTFDESDGQGAIELRVNGVLVESFLLDANLNNGGVSNTNRVVLVVEGVELAPGDVVEVTGVQGGAEWVRIDSLGFAPVDPAQELGADPIVIEAESIIETGYVVAQGSFASGGAYASLFNTSTANSAVSGELRYVFDGEDGVYTLDLSAFDENDGAASLTILVNGVSAAVVTLDAAKNNGGAGADNLVVHTIAGLELTAGDVVSVIGENQAAEWARVDKLVLTRTADLGGGDPDPSPVNEAPTGAVEDVDAVVGDPVTLDLSNLFTDPEGGELTFSISGSGASIASLNGDILTLDPTAAGDYVITIVANDGDLDSAPVSFTLSASAPADPVEPTPPVDSITLEAEDLIASGFAVENQSVAAGGKTTSLLNTGNMQGVLSYSFAGGDGQYDLSIIAFDESDGVSSLDVLVNGERIQTLTLDAQLGEGGVAASNRVSLDVARLDLETGDVVEIVATRGGDEFARLDQIVFTPTGAVEPPVNTAPTGSIEDIDAIVGDAVTIDLSTVFSDAEGGELTFSISGSGASIASLNGDILTLDPTAAGDYVITIVANDGDLDSAPVSFTLSASAPADPVEPTPAVDPITLEAEDLIASGFAVEAQSVAAGGKTTSLLNTGNMQGVLSYNFAGGDGQYDLSIIAFDESDGVSSLDVVVNGERVQTLTLDAQLGQGGVSTANRVSLDVAGLDLETGDLVEIVATRGGEEYARLDQLVFTPVDADPTPDPAPVAGDSVILFADALNFTNGAQGFAQGGGSSTGRSEADDPALGEHSLRATAGSYAQAGVAYGRAINDDADHLQFDIYREAGSNGELVLRYNGFTELTLNASNYGLWTIDGVANASGLSALPTGEWSHVTLDLAALIGEGGRLDAVAVKGDGDGGDTYYFDNVQLTPDADWGLPVETDLFVEKLWTSPYGVLSTPESAQFDPDTGYLFVSNAVSAGAVAILDPSTGGVIDAHWLTGLDTPKGLAVADGRIYIACKSELVVADTSTGEIVSRHPASGVHSFNDVAIGSDGAVYVSDLGHGEIWRLADGQFSVFVSDSTFQQVNGLYVDGDHLFAADFSDGALYSVDLDTKAVAQIVDGVENFDGVAQLAPGEFLVSSFQGVVRIYSEDDGGLTKIVDTTGGQSAADISYDPDSGMLFVPTYSDTGVVAYRVHTPDEDGAAATATATIGAKLALDSGATSEPVLTDVEQSGASLYDLPQSAFAQTARLLAVDPVLTDVSFEPAPIASDPLLGGDAGLELLDLLHILHDGDDIFLS